MAVYVCKTSLMLCVWFGSDKIIDNSSRMIKALRNDDGMWSPATWVNKVVLLSKIYRCFHFSGKVNAAISN